MMYQEDATDEEAKPFLSETSDRINLFCSEQWEKCHTGTLLQMNGVNLIGLGEVAFVALARKLSNFFALDSMGNRKIYLNVNDGTNTDISFLEVNKEIAFKNMAFIDYGANEENSKIPSIIENNRDNIICFPYPRLNGNQQYEHHVEIQPFKELEKVDTSGTLMCVTLDGLETQKKYTLTGWIGLHGSIDLEQASKNDERFEKNKFYNPIQLRLYVRNKLAIENFLNVINNTQAFVNYIEGEIHFNILDEDDLPDIATSNRQNLDEHDPRVQLLVDIVRKIVTNLISKRTDLANKIKETQQLLLGKQTDNAKKQFSKEVGTELDRFSELTIGQKSSLATIVSNKIRGEVIPKSDYIIFISHSSDDKILTDFIYHLLKHKGAKDSEFFYTSRDDTIDQYANIDSLAVQIKKNFIEENVLLLYLTSNAYKKSEFCMFEGGAGWATRSVGDYIVLTLTYGEMPKFITNGKLEYCLERNKNIELSRNTYLFVVKMLNQMISHLNAGRRANALNEIVPFSEIEIPSDLYLCQNAKIIEDYMDNDIKEHWKFYITDNLSSYLDKRYPAEN